MFRVIIAGSRDFSDYDVLKSYADVKLSNISRRDSIEVVSGCARGADTLGERYAEERGYGIKKFPADWNRYGKSAGYLRNVEMAEYADALIAFWDGKSKGTEHMICIAKKSWIEDWNQISRIESARSALSIDI